MSRVKWSNPGKGIAPSPTLRCSSYWKGNLRVALDYGLFARSSNRFKYRYLSAIDPQTPFSSTFKIKWGWVFVCHKSNLKNHIGAWHNQPIDRFMPLILLLKPSKGISEVLQITWPLRLPGNGLIIQQDPFLKHYRSLLTANRLAC